MMRNENIRHRTPPEVPEVPKPKKSGVKTGLRTRMGRDSKTAAGSGG